MVTAPENPALNFLDNCLLLESDYESRDDLILLINNWAVIRGYAFTTGRSTKEKSGRWIIMYLCDRSCHPLSNVILRQRQTTSRGTGC